GVRLRRGKGQSQHRSLSLQKVMLEFYSPLHQTVKFVCDLFQYTTSDDSIARDAQTPDAAGFVTLASATRAAAWHEEGTS
ncbi:MAG: hypothetical protein J0L71_05875, partial [Candidatus Accumulibacter sp.]|uniref:hypothetical protein n=1 Tax=Accumulibacter sp. TaxID=2053492 RepID=UPI001AD17589